MNHPVQRTRTRVRQACQACRIRKTKCDGKQPCEKCKLNDILCNFIVVSKPKVVYPAGFTTMILDENETLKAGLREAFRRLKEFEKFNHESRRDAETPTVNEILEYLNIPFHGSSTSDDSHGNQDCVPEVSSADAAQESPTSDKEIGVVDSPGAESSSEASEFGFPEILPSDIALTGGTGNVNLNFWSWSLARAGLQHYAFEDPEGLPMSPYADSMSIPNHGFDSGEARRPSQRFSF